MNSAVENPFESIENAHDFMTLMAQTVFETKLEIEADVARESSSNYPRRADALKLTLYTLTRLEFHMDRSRRILNDLRTLRRLLFEERTVGAGNGQLGDGASGGEAALPVVTPRPELAVTGPVASA